MPKLLLPHGKIQKHDLSTAKIKGVVYVQNAQWAASDTASGGQVCSNGSAMVFIFHAIAHFAS
jgi:hypothetical protein